MKYHCNVNFCISQVNRDSKMGLYYLTRLFDGHSETYYNADQKGISILTFLLAMIATIVAVITVWFPCCCRDSIHGYRVRREVAIMKQYH